MEWKKDDNGNFISDAKGNPIAVFNTGKEDGIDAFGLINTNNNLQTQIDGYKTNLNTAKESLIKFEGVNPANIKTELAELETLRAKVAAGTATDNELSEQLRSVESMLQKEKDGRIEADAKYIAEKKDAAIASHQKDVRNNIAMNSFLKKSGMTADVASLLFAANFKEEVIDGQSITVGYHKGEKIRSEENAGSIAGFDEAIRYMFNNYENKDHYMKTSQHGGNGGVNGGTDGANKKISNAEWKNLTQQAKDLHVANGGTIEN